MLVKLLLAPVGKQLKMVKMMLLYITKEAISYYLPTSQAVEVCCSLILKFPLILKLGDILVMLSVISKVMILSRWTIPLYITTSFI